MIKELLNKYGLNYEDLNVAEKQTLEEMAGRFQVEELKIDDVRSAVNTMIESLTKELVNYDTPSTIPAIFFRKKKRVHIEARLHNLLLLRDFMLSPERARKVVENMLANIKTQK